VVLGRCELTRIGGRRVGPVTVVLLAVMVLSAGSPAISFAAVSSNSASARSSASLRAARVEAGRLLRSWPLPPGARRKAREPAGGGASLASYDVNIPGWPRLVDLHEFFVVPSATPRSVIKWMGRHRPAGASPGDNGNDPQTGERWNSLYFLRLRRFQHWPDLVINAVPIRGGAVAVRVDAQVGPPGPLPPCNCY
jgi:hypothetical protein